MILQLPSPNLICIRTTCIDYHTTGLHLSVCLEPHPPAPNPWFPQLILILTYSPTTLLTHSSAPSSCLPPSSHMSSLSASNSLHCVHSSSVIDHNIQLMYTLYNRSSCPTGHAITDQPLNHAVSFSCRWNHISLVTNLVNPQHVHLHLIGAFHFCTFLHTGSPIYRLTLLLPSYR